MLVEQIWDLHILYIIDIKKYAHYLLIIISDVDRHFDKEDFLEQTLLSGFVTYHVL